LDRILFGSNTILVFKYPLLKRRLAHIKSQLLSEQPDLSGEDLEKLANKQLAKIGLIDTSEESKEEDEEELRRKQLTVQDYGDDEVEEDDNAIDWDFAFGEILKIEERKKDKAEIEARKKIEEEKARLEEELKRKYEEEQLRNNEELQRQMKHAEALKAQMEQLEQERHNMATTMPA
jgi:hypothetical protein